MTQTFSWRPCGIPTPFPERGRHRLKTIDRQTLIHSGGRQENSAEHSWHLAMAVFVFHSMTKSKADLLKCLKMAIFHDLVEVDAGDTFVYGDQSAQNQRELLAIERLSGLLPDSSGKDLKETWIEFEEAQTLEAKFVKALDRFLPMYSNFLNQGYSWKKTRAGAVDGKDVSCLFQWQLT